MNTESFDKATILEVEQIFLSLEKEYVSQLFQIPEFYGILKDYFAFSNEELMKKFKENHDKMENYQVSEEQSDKVELEMIACVLAMADKVKRLVLARTGAYDRDEDLENGRSR